MRRTPTFACACAFVVLGCTKEPPGAKPLVVPVGSSAPAPIVSSSNHAPEDPAPRPTPRGWLVAGMRLERVTHERAMEVVGQSPLRGVARALVSTADCSSAGAHHLLLTLEKASDGSTDKRAWLKSDLGGLPFPLGARDGDAGTMFAGGMVDGWFVVGVEPRPGREPLRAPCVVGQYYDALVRVIVPVADAAEGERLLHGGR